MRDGPLIFRRNTVHSMGMKRVMCAGALALVLASVVSAQTSGSRLVFAFLGFSSVPENMTESEIRVLENRMTSHLAQIAELENYSITVPNNRFEILEEIANRDPVDNPTVLSSLVSARGVVLGTVDFVSGRYLVELRLIRAAGGQVVASVTADYDSFSRLLEGAGTIVFNVFGFQEPTREVAATASPGLAGTRTHDPRRENTPGPSVQLSFADVAGLWRGDRGIETVRVFTDGSAVASLDEVNTMRLRVAIDGATVTFRQDEPNAPKLYMNTFPYSISTQIVELARPMSWVFGLSEDGRVLEGIKETTLFHIDRGRVVRADNTHTREAVWQRIW